MLDCCVFVFVTFVFFAKISFFFLSTTPYRTLTTIDNHSLPQTTAL